MRRQYLQQLININKPTETSGPSEALDCKSWFLGSFLSSYHSWDLISSFLRIPAELRTRLERAWGPDQRQGAGIRTSPSQDCPHEWGCGVEGGRTSGESQPWKKPVWPKPPCLYPAPLSALEKAPLWVRSSPGQGPLLSI